MNGLYCAIHNLIGDLAVLRHVKTPGEIAEWKEIFEKLINPISSYLEIAEAYDNVDYCDCNTIDKLMDIVEENYKVNDTVNHGDGDGVDDIISNLEEEIDDLMKIIYQIKTLKAKGNNLPPDKFNSLMKKWCVDHSMDDEDGNAAQWYHDDYPFFIEKIDDKYCIGSYMVMQGRFVYLDEEFDTLSEACDFVEAYWHNLRG